MDEISAELGAGAGGHAHADNQAYALQGNATEAADYKTQSYGALVVKVQASVEATQANSHADLQRNNVQWIVCCYTFDSCLRTSPMSQRPKSLASANDADWNKAA